MMTVTGQHTQETQETDKFQFREHPDKWDEDVTKVMNAQQEVLRLSQKQNPFEGRLPGNAIEYFTEADLVHGGALATMANNSYARELNRFKQANIGQTIRDLEYAKKNSRR